MKDLRKKIVAATIDIGSRKGIGSISVKNISAKCGVSPAAMYYHFRDKYELIMESTMTIMQAIANRVDAVIESSNTFEENYKVALQAVVKYGMTHKPECRFIGMIFMVPTLAFDKADSAMLNASFPMMTLLNKGIENGDVINVPQIIKFAFYPILNLLINDGTYITKSSDEEIAQFIDGMYRVISAKQ